MLDSIGGRKGCVQLAGESSSAGRFQEPALPVSIISIFEFSIWESQIRTNSLWIFWTRCRISMCQGLGPKNTMKFRKSTVRPIPLSLFGATWVIEMSKLLKCGNAENVVEYGQFPCWHCGFQRVWLEHNLSLKGWNSQAHRDFLGVFLESFSQAMLVGTMLVGGLGVLIRPGFLQLVVIHPQIVIYYLHALIRVITIYSLVINYLNLITRELFADRNSLRFTCI